MEIGMSERKWGTKSANVRWSGGGRGAGRAAHVLEISLLCTLELHEKNVLGQEIISTCQRAGNRLQYFTFNRLSGDQLD